MIEKEQIEVVIDKIVENYKPEKIILFGSYAYGNPNRDSDLDICVIKNIDTPRYERGREIRKYLRGMMIPIDLLVYTPAEIEEWKDVKHSFIYNILKRGKILYE